MRSMRRSGDSEAFSLFAFQDIMIAVMGILILITLILALNLSEATEIYAETSSQIASSDDSQDGITDLQREQAAELLREYAELKRQEKILVQRAEDIAASVEAGEDGRRKILAELNALHEAIATLNEEVSRRKKDLGSQSELSESIRENERAVYALLAQRNSLQKKLKARSETPA